MTKRPNRRKSVAKKFICGLLIAAALVALFFVSFSITKLVLNSNQIPKIGSGEKQEDASSTPKPTYEELEKMVIEKDKKIKELEDELERYKEKAVQETISPSAPSPDSAPQATKAPQETKTPTPAPTSAPTQTPAPTAQAPAPAAETPAAADAASAA